MLAAFACYQAREGRTTTIAHHESDKSENAPASQASDADIFLSGLRERWSRLTAEDLERIGADRSELIEILMRRYDRTREVAEREVCQYDASLVDKARDEGDSL